MAQGKRERLTAEQRAEMWRRWKGRDFAAWLGVVPQQYSTGGKAKLLGISKRGNVYLRKVLIHGARAKIRARRTCKRCRSRTMP